MIIESDPKLVIVNVGTTRSDTVGNLHKVKRVIKHEMYDQNSVDFDFALLELNQNIIFSDKAKPIRLIGATEKIVDNTECLTTGWGITQSNSESNTLLRGVNIVIINQQKCQKLFSQINNISNTMLCAGLLIGGKDTCRGKTLKQ